MQYFANLILFSNKVNEDTRIDISDTIIECDNGKLLEMASPESFLT